MIRKSDLLWLSIAAFSGVTLFHTSYQVQGLREEKTSLERQIASENDGIQVLKAEWSFLNDPSRLEQLAATHLTLKPITGTQVASFDALPVRPATAPVLVSQPVPAAPSATAAPRKAVTAPTAAAAARVSVRPVAATLASVSAPSQPQVRSKLNRQQHPVVARPTLVAAHASAGPSAPRYRGGDEIGALLSRLGRVQ